MRLRWFAVVLALLAAARPVAGKGAPVLEQVADVPLPGPSVRFDYQSVDTTARRLYVAHMNGRFRKSLPPIAVAAGKSLACKRPDRLRRSGRSS